MLGALLIFALAAPNLRAANSETVHESASAGCGKPGKTGSFTLAALDGIRRSRSYLVQVPEHYDSSRPYALTFVFHAWGGSGAQAAGWGLQQAAGASQLGIFVFPNGVEYRSEGVGWDDRIGGYDLPLFDHMLKDMESSYCVDAGKVFVAGFSWGGDFAIALACSRGEIIRAVAANSTVDEFADKNKFMTYQNLPCPSTTHPPVRFEHAVDGDPQYPSPYFATTSKLFQSLNGCSAASTPAASSSPVMSCASFNGCRSPYVECAFDHKLGHVLPPNWAQDTWDFFMEQAAKPWP